MTTDAAGTSASASTLNPEKMSEMVQAGTLCLENGDLRGALEAFEQVVAAFPDRPEGHNNLGALYTSLGEFAQAEACFDQVLKILPDNPGIYYNRGMARSSQEKFDGAREDFLRALDADPADVDCLNNLGVMDFMQGKFDEARSRFQAALQIRPDYPRALLNLCDVAMAENNQAEAIRLCEDYLRTRQSPEVRRTLLDILGRSCRSVLDKADRTAAGLLAAGAEDPEISRELFRIRQAKAALEEQPRI